MRPVPYFLGMSWNYIPANISARYRQLQRDGDVSDIRPRYLQHPVLDLRLCHTARSLTVSAM